MEILPVNGDINLMDHLNCQWPVNLLCSKIPFWLLEGRKHSTACK